MNEGEPGGRNYAAWFGDPQARQGVQGFLHEPAARAFAALLKVQEEAAVRGALAEIGVFHGLSFIGLARASRAGERVLAVDPFASPEGSFRGEFQANLQARLTGEQLGRVKILEARSEALNARDWCAALQSPARLVHIDGMHRRDAVLHDLALATAWIAPAAVVVFDDFLHDLYPDVTTGVIDGLRATNKILPLAIVPRTGPLARGGSKLVCCAPGHFNTYLPALDRAMELNPLRTDLIGRTVRTYQPPD